MAQFVVTLVGILVIFYILSGIIGYVVIYEFQKGLLYRHGAFKQVLGAGKHYYLKRSSSIEVIDVRKTMFTLPGQEILTRDNISLKVSLTGFYEITDPVLARHSSTNYVVELYNQAQIILRDLIGALTFEEVLEKKIEIDAQLLATTTEMAKALGLTVTTLAIRDIMLPANLKKAFSGVLEAQKEAQRQLEKARGEQAVLRSLANGSQMYEANPMLLQARLVQALSSGENSIVFNADDGVVIKRTGK